MGSAFLTATSLSCTLFGTVIMFLGLWVTDLESKRKTFKICLYLFVISCTKQLLGKNNIVQNISSSP